MDSSSSARALVEYHDPTNLYPAIRSRLNSLLPLKNIPLVRFSPSSSGIDSLHIDFQLANQLPVSASIPDDLAAPAAATDQNAPRGSVSSIAGAPPGAHFAQTSRRHQIPGLRSSPTLKMLLVRCDTSEAYKAVKRSVKEWIKTHTLSKRYSGSGASTSKPMHRGGHESFEYLIVHVVFPDTEAAESAAAGTAADRSSIWNKMPLAERIRSDFTEKGTDRFAQVRITSPGATAGVQQSLASWSDLAGKIKCLVLAAVDVRVKQYEADIRERNQRRSLPGWNFCPHFVLKEGLARTFESVGLVRDALDEYDELFAEVEVLSDSNLYDYAHSLQDEYSRLLAPGEQQTDTPAELSYMAVPVSAERRDFRQLILENKISFFEFNLYVFSRQTTLLLRLADGNNPPSDGSTPVPVSQVDINIFSELFARTLAFASTIAPIFRADLRASRTDTDERVISNMATSWIYRLLTQILDRVDVAIEGVVGMTEREKREVCTYSASRAELLLIQRGLLEEVAARKGWYSGLSRLQKLARDGGMEEVSLDDDDDDDDDDDATTTLTGLDPSLRTAITSHEAFVEEYEQITSQALQFLQYADRPYLEERLVGDIASIDYANSKFDLALPFFERAVAMFENWIGVESVLLKAYSHCLKELNRPEYVHSLIKQVELAVSQNDASDLEGIWPQIEEHFLSDERPGGGPENPEKAETVLLLTDVVTNLQFDRDIRHFDDRDGFKFAIKATNILPDRISFASGYLVLRGIGSLDNVVRMSLVTDPDGSAGIGPNSTGELLFRSRDNITGLFTAEHIELGIGKLLLFDSSREANFRASSNHGYDRFALESADTCGRTSSILPQKVHVFPHPDSLQFDLRSSSSIVIDRRKELEITVHTNRNDIEHGEITVKSMTAGLRLFTASAYSTSYKTTKGPASPTSSNQSKLLPHESVGVVKFKQLDARSVVTIQLPYTTDGRPLFVLLGVSVLYKTAIGVYRHSSIYKTNVSLPLDVNVHDSFKKDALFSAFNIQNITTSPISLSRLELRESESFSVTGPPVSIVPSTLFPGSTTSVVYRVVHRENKPGLARSPLSSSVVQIGKPRLRLLLSYAQLDERILQQASKRFKEAVKDSPVAFYERLIVPFFETMLARTLASTDLNKAYLRHVLPLRFDEREWAVGLDGLGSAADVLEWVKGWFGQNETCAIESENSADAGVRTLNIAVPIPSVPVVCTARLKFHLDRDASLAELNPAASASPNPTLLLAEPVPATLSISFTSRWDWDGQRQKSPGSVSLRSPSGLLETLLLADEEGMSALPSAVDPADAGGRPTIDPIVTAAAPEPTSAAGGGGGGGGKPAKTCRLVYQLDVPPDCWALDGHPRRQFVLAEGDTASFPLTLVPLRPGPLVLPSVEIHSVEAGPSRRHHHHHQPGMASPTFSPTLSPTLSPRLGLPAAGGGGGGSGSLSVPRPRRRSSHSPSPPPDRAGSQSPGLGLSIPAASSSLSPSSTVSAGGAGAESPGGLPEPAIPTTVAAEVDYRSASVVATVVPGTKGVTVAVGRGMVPGVPAGPGSQRGSVLYDGGASGGPVSAFVGGVQIIEAEGR